MKIVYSLNVTNYKQTIFEKKANMTGFNSYKHKSTQTQPDAIKALTKLFVSELGLFGRI